MRPIFCLNWLLFNFHDCCYSTIPILRTPNHIIVFSAHQFKLLVNKDHSYFKKICRTHNHLHLPWCPIPYVSVGSLMQKFLLNLVAYLCCNLHFIGYSPFVLQLPQKHLQHGTTPCALLVIFFFLLTISLSLLFFLYSAIGISVQRNHESTSVGSTCLRLDLITHLRSMCRCIVC